MSSTLAVLGGLFDPVHKGHVSAANFALDFLSLDRLKMVPCHVPNHKALPETAAGHRLAMLEIATAPYPQIEVDPIELQSSRVSYTVDTLTKFKQQFASLVFVLGVDSFNTLPQWHNWQRLLELSHLLVLSRPGSVLSADTLAALEIERRRVESAEQMLSSGSGKIIFCEGFEYDMASSAVREKLLQGRDVSAELDAGVVRYIEDNGLYRN